ncbi:MAG: Fe-S cluster assembly scaffold protein NifU [Candidatus Latescibacterota bacterium]|jgi:nitrogen fixation NifU-like protein|nr:MAG: Fe-S cluster assembly scaffold protein NifU [Candidatus Latescibacterota bacterium]
MALYSDKVMDHFMNPRNVGDIPGADGVGEVGNPVCGDMMTFYIKVKDDRLADVKFKTFGCGAAIAVSSMVSEMATGKTLDEAMKITNESVAEELGGLPKNKMHCSNLGADALHAAIENYRARKRGEPAAAATAAHGHDHDECTCPFCDAEIDKEDPICRRCGVEFLECPACGKLASNKDAACPHCGAAMGKKE